MFSILISRGTGTNCCHVRLLKILLPFTQYPYGTEPSNSPLINLEKVSVGISCRSATVLSLPSKDGVERFSVVAQDSIETVTIFSVLKSAKRIVKCHSSTCKMQQLGTRSVQSLNLKPVCPHLMVLKPYISLVQNITSVDESDDEIDEFCGDNLEEEILTLPDENNFPFPVTSTYVLTYYMFESINYVF